MAEREDFPGRIAGTAAALLLALAAAAVLRPFFSVLVAAAVVAVVVRPLHARLLRRWPRPGLSAAGVAGGVCVALAVPTALGGWYLARESVRAYPLLREWLDARLVDFDLRGMMLDNVHEILDWSRATAANAAFAGVDALVFALFLFVFLRDGPDLVERARAALPLAAEHKSRIFERAREMVVATVQGVFAVALVQGVLSAAGFALFGVRFPVLLGALCMMLSPIPVVGPTLVWLPVVARMALGGEVGKAAMLAGWFALVVGLADNVVRPILVGTRGRLPVALVVVGVLGGIKAFGVIGIFLGPVIIAVAEAVIDVLFPRDSHERG